MKRHIKTSPTADSAANGVTNVINAEIRNENPIRVFAQWYLLTSMPKGMPPTIRPHENAPNSNPWSNTDHSYRTPYWKFWKYNISDNIYMFLGYT